MNAGSVPGVITLTQPKAPAAKVRGSRAGFQCVLVGPERVLGVRKGVTRGPVGPPGPPELAALVRAVPDRQVVLAWGETGPLSQGAQARRQALRTRHINGTGVRKKRPRGFKKEAQGGQVSPPNPLSVSPWYSPSQLQV
jgi:hypothetical protein